MGITGKQRGRHIFPDGVGGGARYYPADGAISPTGGTHYLNKAGAAGAYTIPAPSSDGIALSIVTRTAFAHVVTGTGLFDDGTAATSKNAATAPAFPGAALNLVSGGGKWNALGKQGFVIA